MTYPDCPNTRHDPIRMSSDCRFIDEGSISTCMHSPIEYDRDGKPISGGLNRVTSSLSCSVCGRKWIETRTELERAQGKPATWAIAPNG